MIMSQSEEVQTKVLNALFWDLVVPPHRVEVQVENGWVTISGGSIGIVSAATPNPTRAGLLACSASTIIFGFRRRTRSKGPRPVAIAAAPPPRLTPPNDCKRFGIAVVFNLISTALRTQSGRRTVKYRLTEIAPSWD